MNNEEIKKILKETEALLKRKNEMYGDENIKEFGEEGVMVRLSDKIQRLRNLTKKGANPPEETIEDTWEDIIGYGVIGLMLRRGKWEK